MKIKKRYIKAECEYRAKEDSLSYLASEKIMSIFVSTLIIDDLKEENEILRDHIKKLNNSDYLDVLERENERLRSENWHLQYDRFIRPSFAGDFYDSNDK